MHKADGSKNPPEERDDATGGRGGAEDSRCRLAKGGGEVGGEDMMI